MKKLLLLLMLIPSLCFAADKTIMLQYGGPNLGGITMSLIPDTDDAYDLGSTTKEWKDLWIDGTANIDSLVADTADINAGTFDGTVGGTTPATGTFTTLTATGTLHGKIEIVADDNSLSAAQCYGSVNNLNGAETTTLPAAVAGMNVLIYSNDATVKTIDPNGTDHIWLNGVDNGASNGINSPGAVGDYIVLVAFSANNWYSIGQSGTWIDTP